MLSPAIHPLVHSIIRPISIQVFTLHFQSVFYYIALAEFATGTIA